MVHQRHLGQESPILIPQELEALEREDLVSFVAASSTS